MKKNKLFILSLLIIGILFMFSNSCKKDKTTAISTNLVSDINGNQYHTITIGSQVWMVENLKVTKYRNGVAIPNVTTDSIWYNLTTGAYCDYKNTPGNSSSYGRLYNWYAVNDSNNIAPIGWHVATNADWTTLTNYLGGDTIAGGKLKVTGTTFWVDTNAGATNIAGFSAMAGGYRYSTFYYLGSTGLWWTSSKLDTLNAWYRGMYNDFEYVVTRSINKSNGLSVRCVKD